MTEAEIRGSESDGADVFLSYSREDQPVARKLLEQLEAAGISVWWDAMLEGGARFHQVTEKNLELARVVVVLWSKVSTASHWVHDEATRGRDRGCLIPVSIDGTAPPLGFRQFQWLDLSNSDWSPDDSEITKLIAAVQARIDPNYSAAESDWSPTTDAGVQTGVRQTSAFSSEPSKAGFTIDRRAAIAGGGLLTVGLAGLGAWQLGMFGSSELEKRIAVLPFEGAGDTGTDDYFVDGFANSIRAQLSRNPLLHVAAKASSQSITGEQRSAKQISQALGVNYLVNGSIQRSGGRIRVTGELSEGPSDRLILPIDFEATAERVFDIQSQIVNDIVTRLTDQAESSAAAQLGGTANVSAYDAYLKGRELYEAGIDESSDRTALALFEQAIALDPQYSAAHAMRGQTLSLIGNLYAGPADRQILYADAVKAAESAIEVAPDYAEGYVVLGYVKAMSMLDMRSGRAPFEKAYELGRGDASTVSRYATFMARTGNFNAAREAIGISSALDPLNASVFRFAGNIAYYSRQFGAAMEQYTKARDISPNMSSLLYLIGLTQLARGDAVAAKISFEAERRFVWKKTGLAIVEHHLGNRSAAEQQFAELQAQQGDKSHYQYMQVHAQWGDEAAALDALDAAWQARDPGLVLLYVDPLLDSLRETPLYQSVVEQIGFS